MPSGTNSSGLLRAASFTRFDEIAGGFGCSSSITMKVRSEIAIGELSRVECRQRVESGQLGDLGSTGASRYRRSVPVTTMSTVRLPHRGQASC
jgi:hypothetical protein